MEANLLHWAKGSKYDVKLSYEDYLDMVDIMRDERLSRNGVFRFKNLNEINSIGIINTALISFPFAFFLTRFISGKTNRSTSGYRIFGSILSVVYPITCWFFYTRPIPKKLYTDIICDNGEDGTYVRLVHKKPGLWSKISPQLHQLGYTFPEITENSNQTEFPTNFVK